MAPHVTAIERLRERPIAVDPAAIEDEFARIWRETSGAGYDESSVRLRVLNFVAIGGDGAASRFDAVMQDLPEHHPCRGILATTIAGRRRVDAAISARCMREEAAAPDVCSEEVLLRGGPAQESELASAVLALLVPEIPVATWLVGASDVSSYLASEVLEASDTLLADSGDGAPGPALRALMLAEREHDLRVFDLAWGRTETWRELTAQFFDGDRVRELSEVRSIEIRGHRGRASAESMLLAGWLVSRLGFALADLDGDDEELRATLYDGTRGVTLKVGAGWAPDLMTLICITTVSGEFELQAHEVSRHVHVVERHGGEESRRTVEAPAVDDAALVLLGLDRGPDRRIYREAAVAALALLGE